MQPVLLIDFGSTYTKLTAVDTQARSILGTAQAFTTAASDISTGLDQAMQRLTDKTGKLDFTARLACSSAAGGLRMVACGLVPALTAKAARFAAFGAGAKVIKTYSYELTEDDAAQIEDINPDILLLVGGIDGGNSDVVKANARVIAGIKGTFPVVFAGNRAALADCRDTLANSTHPVYTASNVMPTLGKLDAAPVQQVIREIFLQRIIHFKGLSRFSDILDGIMMPTPAAVLAALTLLSRGTGGRAGIGDLVAVDLGGATTDVYSIASGDPVNPSTFLHGLREPYVKRTVEGDIGMRYSARGVVEAAGMDELLHISGLTEDQALQGLAAIERDPSVLPQTQQDQQLDYALAVLAIRLGLIRHAGTLEEVYTPSGPMFRQSGKDLTQVSRMILTGGALIHAQAADSIAQQAVRSVEPGALVPRKFGTVRDERYILSAMGLLAGHDEDAALEILLQHFGKEETHAAAQ